MWQKAGYKARAVVKGAGSVKAQIDYLKQHKIHIDGSCVNTTKEIQQWKWQKDSKSGQYTDEPVNVFDDAMAALRYCIEPYRKEKRMKTINKSAIGL
jgi:phage terminase large subunit